MAGAAKRPRQESVAGEPPKRTPPAAEEPGRADWQDLLHGIMTAILHAPRGVLDHSTPETNADAPHMSTESSTGSNDNWKDLWQGVMSTIHHAPGGLLAHEADRSLREDACLNYTETNEELAQRCQLETPDANSLQD
eukprot:TRINITY_DN11597_c0_g1_i1.p1 TRINITY_DN11597_c0_g1~~TRINITY_DN11597_c0_g1_i1.p1  ORF type:complete len:152 (+),score=35.81 TRINITY_DN11597_c0_g1_i1:48-458(+)